MIFAPLVRGLSESRRVVSARHRSLSISAQKLRRAFDLSSPAAIPHHSLLIAFDNFTRGAPKAHVWALRLRFLTAITFVSTNSQHSRRGRISGRICAASEGLYKLSKVLHGLRNGVELWAVAIYLASTHRHLTSTLKFFSFSQRWSRLDDVVYTSTDVEDLSDMLAVVEVCCSTKDEKSLLCRLFRATCQSVAQFDEFTF